MDIIITEILRNCPEELSFKMLFFIILDEESRDYFAGFIINGWGNCFIDLFWI